MESAIRIEGLAQFNKALKQLDGDLPKMTRLAMNKAAGVVINYGQSKIARRTGRASSTIRARSTRTMVRVVEGGPKAQYVPWLDFGGRVGRNRSVVRPFYKQGRYLYPALTERRAEIQQALESALTEVAEKAGLELG